MKTIALLAIAGLAGAAQAQLNLTLVANIDLIDLTGNAASDKYIGTSPAAVAWNGSEAYIAGWNNFGSSPRTALARVSNVFGTPSFSNAFGVINSASGRGYLDITRKGNNVYAAYENGGGQATNGIYGYDVSGGLPPTNFANFLNSGYRASGIDVDSRTGDIVSSSVATGLRQFVLNDDASLTAIYGPIAPATAGYSILPTTDANTNWRDVQIDDATGDVYYRKQNDVWVSRRTGDNAGSVLSVLVDMAAGDQSGQAIEILRGTADGDFIIFNSRTGGNPGQTFASNFRVATMNGTLTTANFIGFDPSAANPGGNGWYDYDYDAASRTLAVTDFGNKRLYIFAVPTPGATAVLGVAGLLAARRRRA
ncbi:MAG: hypothetical protein SFZ23_08290 [Planctomycetota bacterium]|nr:hypothetical protein [Planctomycetota bacterium]